ncbi:hypothetical protein C2845_PM05G30650 [Panicum miliaceum]|uniref:Uncharacterized protein n=1 Tax=Panicum miliaceum TaxID=4540 RepID=A0A3L6T436_PANMI|nr:hypothetical protein C2845_PM05G30650 [Panicum miliaceum]
MNGSIKIQKIQKKMRRPISIEAMMVKKGIKGWEEIYEALVEAGHQVTQLPIDEDMDTDGDCRRHEDGVSTPPDKSEDKQAIRPITGVKAQPSTMASKDAKLSRSADGPTDQGGSLACKELPPAGGFLPHQHCAGVESTMAQLPRKAA